MNFMSPYYSGFAQCFQQIFFHIVGAQTKQTKQFLNFCCFPGFDSHPLQRKNNTVEIFEFGRTVQNIDIIGQPRDNCEQVFVQTCFFSCRTPFHANHLAVIRTFKTNPKHIKQFLFAIDRKRFSSVNPDIVIFFEIIMYPVCMFVADFNPVCY